MATDPYTFFFVLFYACEESSEGRQEGVIGEERFLGDKRWQVMGRNQPVYLSLSLSLVREREG